MIFMFQYVIYVNPLNNSEITINQNTHTVLEHLNLAQASLNTFKPAAAVIPTDLSKLQSKRLAGTNGFIL